MEKGYPLILVFYLDRELMQNGEIMQGFAKEVNNAIAQREANMMAFFLPTDDTERIECLNPIQIEEADMERIDKIISELEKNFDIGQGADEEKTDDE